MAPTPYAELHGHTNFSFLDGASPADDLVERAVELGLTGLAVTDHAGLYGAVRFVGAAEAVGLHPVIGLEIELLDPAVADPGGIVVAPRRRPATDRAGRRMPRRSSPIPSSRACPRGRGRSGSGCPVIASRSRRICAGSASAAAARISCCSPGPRSGGGACAGSSRGRTWPARRRCRASARRCSAEHTEGLVALSGCRDGELARRLRVGDRSGARAVAERYATLFGRGEAAATSGFFIELSHHLLADDDWLVAESVALADDLGLPVVVTNDVHYARPEDRELADVLTAIRHGRTLDTLGDLRRPDGESFLKSGDGAGGHAAGRRGGADGGAPGRRGSRPRSSSRRRARSISGSSSTASRASRCRTGRRRSRTSSELCQAGARKRYHPLTSAGRQAARPRARRHRAGRASPSSSSSAGT